MGAFTAIRWALAAPVVRRADGRPDATAHHVLLALATFADRGGHARPSTVTLADATTLAVDTVTAALRRLTADGLIVAEGAFGGTGATVWRLNLAAARTDSGDLSTRQERAREKARERGRRFRERRRPVTVSETVTQAQAATVSDTVTNGAGDRDDLDRNGVGHRDERCPTPLLTASDTVTNGADTVITADERPRTANELPLNCHRTTSASAAPPSASGRGYAEAFEAFWAAYGRKGNKRAAATEWARAIKRADPAVIMAAVAPYVASTPDLQYRKGAEGWLKNDRWESVVVPRAGGTDRYQPYSNPADQSVYDQPI